MKKGFLATLLSITLTISLLMGCGSALATTTDAADQTPVTITYYTWVQSADGSYPQNMSLKKGFIWTRIAMRKD